jgi:hypothetical protein
MENQSRNITVASLSICLIIILCQTNISAVNAYWEKGNDDCISEHGVGTIVAKYFESIDDITLDGVASESTWADTQEFIVPTACRNDSNNSEYFFISYIHIKIAYDKTNLYVLCQWNDSGAVSFPHQQDAISICWNINVKNYTAGMFINPALMKTLEPDESVDNWKWTASTTYGNGSSYKVKDQSFGNDSWRGIDTEKQDVESAYTYGNWSDGINKYSVEMKRALVTNDDDRFDVQFNKNGEYLVTFAVMDNMGGEDHAVSYTWKVIFDSLSETIDAFDVMLIGMTAMIFIPILMIYVKRKKMSKID